MNPAPRILLIGSAGRSGSTLLERLMDGLPGWDSVGEVWSLFQAASDGRICGCGQVVTSCALWSEVLEEAVPGASTADHQALHAQIRSTLRHRHLFRLLRARQSDVAGGELVGIVRRLYRAIQDRLGSRVLVDASKSLPWAIFLERCLPETDFAAVQLVRDSRGVAYSHGRRKLRRDKMGAPEEMFSLPAWRVSLQWLYMNVGWGSIRFGGKRAKLVRYEDFTQSPKSTLKDLGDFISTPIDDRALDYLQGASARLGPSHGVVGNPGRFDLGTIPIQRDDEWKTLMRQRERAIVTGITAPLLKVYGYSLRGVAEDCR